MPTQQGKEPATSLRTSSIFRDNLVSVLCWRRWPGPEQPGGGDLLQVGMCGDGQYTVRMHARVQSRKHPQPFVFLAQLTSPFEMA